MKNILLLFSFFLLALSSCSRKTTFQLPPGSNFSVTPPAPKGDPITGPYCTPVNHSQFSSGEVPINLNCLQSDGTWTPQNGFPEGPQLTGDPLIYVSPSLSRASNGDLLMSYIRLGGTNGTDLMVARYNVAQSWNLTSTTPVNGTGSSIYTQFGGNIFDFLGKTWLFWTTSTNGVLSSWNLSTWTQMSVAPGLANLMRHPEVLIASSGTSAYLYYGEPTPTVWRFNGTTLTSLGGPSINSGTEWSLYSSLTEWNGQLALAYTSSDYLTSQNWNVTTDVTKIALWDGVSWNQISSGIQETPGHDGVTPYLFDLNGDLHVLYSDYTTTGLPTNSQKISFRFRVKRWTGLVWVPVGTESDVVNLSQRFEFYKDNNNIFVHVFQPDPTGPGTREVVMTWNSGNFGYLGQPIRTFPLDSFKMSYRPGAIVSFQ